MAIVAVAVAASAAELTVPLLLMRVVDRAIPRGDGAQLATLALIMLAATVAGGALTVAANLVASRVGNAVGHQLRVQSYAHVQSLSLPASTAVRAGEANARILSDTAAAEAALRTLFTRTLRNTIDLVLAIGAIALVDARMLVVAMVAVPPAALVARRIGDRRGRAAQEFQQATADVSGFIGETAGVAGLILTRSLGCRRQLTDRFTTSSARLADLGVAREMAARWAEAALTMTVMLLPPLAYWVGGLAIINGKGLTIGGLMAFVVLQRQLFFPLQDLLTARANLRIAAMLFTRVFTFLDTPSDVPEPADPRRSARHGWQGELRFDRVSLVHDPTIPPVIDNVSLTVPAGATFALVGTTGSGKTSLGYLAQRLLDPTDGRVLIDGVDLRDLSGDAVSDAVCLMGQEPYLLHDTVRANLLLAAPDAGEPDLVAACRAAQIHEVIAQLPHGYDTVVGERGSRFSGGEKQRLALARALLRPSRVLILDEATSALDAHTERQVVDALGAATRNRTVVVITHRLSTVRHADRIVVLHAGRVVEVGTHEKLMAIGGRYATMVATARPTATASSDRRAGDRAQALSAASNPA